VLPSEGGRRKLFSQVVKDEKDKRYTIKLKAKDSRQSSEQIKLQLMGVINPTDIKTLRDGRLVIETGNEKEINSLRSAISTKCGEELEIIKKKLRKPRLIICNFSDEITIEKVTIIIKAQNPEFTLNTEDFVAKFRYKNMKGKYNIVIEAGLQTRKQLLQTKLKIG